MKEFRAIVSGKVQGVSFRDFVYEQARALSVCGCVRNQPDGTVYVLGQGNEGDLETLIQKLNEGSPRSAVSGVQVDWREVSNPYPVFQVEY